MEAVDGRGGIQRSAGTRACRPSDLVATGSGDSPGAVLGVGTALILVNVASVGVALLVANMHGRPSAADFGLRRPPLGRAVGLLLAIWIALTAITGLWIVALGISDDESPLTERLGTDGTLTVLVLIVVLTILAPLQEEFLLFRGYIFRALRNRQGLWPAATTTGALFAATHVRWTPIALIVIVIVIGLCLLYHWTGSLYPASRCTRSPTRSPSAARWTGAANPGADVRSTLAALTIARLIALALGDGAPDSGDEHRRVVARRDGCSDLLDPVEQARRPLCRSPRGIINGVLKGKVHRDAASPARATA